MRNRRHGSCGSCRWRAGALAEAHAIGLIHRDIKPANIILCTQGGERDAVKLRARRGRGLLAGSELFDGKSIIEVCSQHLSQPPAPLATRGVTVPSDLEAIVMPCLEKDPDRRPQTAVDLRKQIEACGIEPWTAELADGWWAEHQSALDRAPERSTAGPRTIMVDGARSPAR